MYSKFHFGRNELKFYYLLISNVTNHILCYEYVFYEIYAKQKADRWFYQDIITFFTFIIFLGNHIFCYDGLFFKLSAKNNSNG